MTDLRVAFETAGCTNVRSYIQSGNVIFDAPPELPLQRVSDEISSLACKQTSVLYRTVDELAGIVSIGPFGEYASDRALKLYVVFLESTPSRELRLPVVDEKERLELVNVTDREAYLVSRRKPSGMYGFPTIFLERELGVTTTARNWSTVTKLLAFAKGDAG